MCGVDLDVGESEFGDTDPGGGSGVDPQRSGTAGVVVVGVDREVVDASTGAGKEAHPAEDPGQPPHVLVLQVTGRRPLVDAYGQGVGSGTQKRSDVELARQSTTGGKTQFGAVEPDPEKGIHAFEPKDRRPFRPVFGQGEFTPVVSGGVFVGYVRRIDRERVRGVGVCGRPVPVELPVRGYREQVPPRGVEAGLFEPFGRGVGPAVQEKSPGAVEGEFGGVGAEVGPGVAGP